MNKSSETYNVGSIPKALGILLVGVVLSFGALSSHAQNLLIDPGFELQTPPAEDIWAGPGGWVSFGGSFSNVHARTGNWSMFDSAYYGAPGTFQQFPAAPGSKWRLTGYGFTPSPLSGDPGSTFGIVQFSFFDIDGNDLGTVETAGNQFPAKTSNPVNAYVAPSTWVFLDTGTATAPAGAAYIQAFTLYIDFSGVPNQGVYFDDLSLNVLVANHGQYVSSIARNAAALARAGSISEEQKGAMVRWAAQSGGGKK